MNPTLLRFQKFEASSPSATAAAQGLLLAARLLDVHAQRGVGDPQEFLGLWSRLADRAALITGAVPSTQLLRDLGMKPPEDFAYQELLVDSTLHDVSDLILRPPVVAGMTFNQASNTFYDRWRRVEPVTKRITGNEFDRGTFATVQMLTPVDPNEDAFERMQRELGSAFEVAMELGAALQEAEALQDFPQTDGKALDAHGREALMRFGLSSADLAFMGHAIGEETIGKHFVWAAGAHDTDARLQGEPAFRRVARAARSYLGNTVSQLEKAGKTDDEIDTIMHGIAATECCRDAVIDSFDGSPYATEDFPTHEPVMFGVSGTLPGQLPSPD